MVKQTPEAEVVCGSCGARNAVGGRQCHSCGGPIAARGLQYSGSRMPPPKERSWFTKLSGLIWGLFWLVVIVGVAVYLFNT